jgi:hypothetical protein
MPTKDKVPGRNAVCVSRRRWEIVSQELGHETVAVKILALATA